MAAMLSVLSAALLQFLWIAELGETGLLCVFGSVTANLGETGLLCVFWLPEPPHVSSSSLRLVLFSATAGRDGDVCVKVETVNCQAIKAILDTPLSRGVRACVVGWLREHLLLLEHHLHRRHQET